MDDKLLFAYIVLGGINLFMLLALIMLIRHCEKHRDDENW